VVVVVYIIKNAAAKGMPEPKSLNIEQVEQEIRGRKRKVLKQQNHADSAVTSPSKVSSAATALQSL